MSRTHRHSTPVPDRLCTVCDRVPTFDAYMLCKECGDDLWADLLQVCEPPRDRNNQPGRTLVDELRLTIANCDRIAARNLGIAVRSSTTTLPWKEQASSALRDLTYTLQCWASTTAGCAGIHEELLTTAEAAAEWILKHFNWVRTLDIANQAHTQIVKAIKDAEWAVDRRADRSYAGPCSVENDATGELCEGEVYGKPGDPFGTCNACHAEYNMAERRDWLLKRSSNYLVTAAEASRALPDLLGRPLNVKTVRTWANAEDKQRPGRRRLVQKGIDGETRAPLFRLGDIVDLALVTEIRQRGRAQERREAEQLDTPA